MNASMHPGYSEALEAAKYIEAHWGSRPGVGIVLGSGLGAVAGQVRGAKRIPYQSIPHFPRPTVQGHAGTLHLALWEGMPTAMLEGRMHLYEGYTPAQVVFPVRALALAGIEVLVLTCAAGGIAPRATPGSFMFLSDHLNLQGMNPLAGAQEQRWGTRFVDVSHAYDVRLRRIAHETAASLRMKFFEGVYAAVLGPSFETPAEIRALRRFGADAVGMSTVPEVLAARQMGVRVLAIATITNRAAGLSKRPLSHTEVLEVGKKATQDLSRFLALLVSRIAPRGARRRPAGARL